MPSIRELLTRRRTKSLSTPQYGDDRGDLPSVSPTSPVSPNNPTGQTASGPRVQQRIHPNLNALAEELAPSIQGSPISDRRPAPSLDSADNQSFMSGLTPWIRNRRHSTGGASHTTRPTFSTTNHETNDAKSDVHPPTILHDLPEVPAPHSSLPESFPERPIASAEPVVDHSASSSTQSSAPTPDIRSSRLLNRLAGITRRPSNPSPTNRNRLDLTPPSAWSTFGQKRKGVKSRDSIPHMTDFGLGRSNAGEISYASSQRSSAYGDYDSSRVSPDPMEADRPQSQQSRSESSYGHSRAPSHDSPTLSRSHSRTQTPSYTNSQSHSFSYSQSRSPSQVFVTPASTPGGRAPSPPSSGFTFGSGTLGRKQKHTSASTPPPPMPKLRLSLFGRADSTRSRVEVKDPGSSSDAEAQSLSADKPVNVRNSFRQTHPTPRPSSSMPSIATSVVQPSSAPSLPSMPSMPSLSPRLKAQDIFTSIAQSSEGKQGNDSDIATMALPNSLFSDASLPGVSELITRAAKKESPENGLTRGRSSRDYTVAGLRVHDSTSPTSSANDSEALGTTRDSEMIQQASGSRIGAKVLVSGSGPEFAPLHDVPGSICADAPVASTNAIANADVTRLADSPGSTSKVVTVASSPPSTTPSAPSSSEHEKSVDLEAMSFPQIDKGKGKGKADGTTPSRLSPPSHSTSYSGIYSIPRVPSPLAQDQSRRTRLTSAPTSATSPLLEEIHRSRMRPATASSASAGWKRKAEDGEDGSASGHRKRATFAADTFTRPRQSSGSSYAGRKRARLSDTPEGELAPMDKEILRRNSTQRSRTISQSTTGQVPRRNISSSHSHASYSQYSQFSQNTSVDDSSSPLHLRQQPNSSSSKAPSIISSIPVSALITPRAPSVSASQHRSATGSYRYHMRDPRKPPKVQPTSWRLSFPETDGEKSASRRLLDMLWGSWRSEPSGLDGDKGKEADIETAMSKHATNSSSGHRGWIEAGGSPIHAWLFFIGFIVFPLWWIGGFIVSVPRTRKLGEGGNEKSVILDDPQVEHDALSWRKRCRVMSLVSLFTYVPFIVLVAIFVPRD